MEENKLFEYLEGFAQELEDAGLIIDTKEEMNEVISTYYEVKGWEEPQEN